MRKWGATFVRSTLECAWQGHRFGSAVESRRPAARDACYVGMMCTVPLPRKAVALPRALQSFAKFAATRASIKSHSKADFFTTSEPNSRPAATYSPPLRAVRCRRGPRILGPRMLRVAATEFLAHLLVRAVPEAAQILRDLDGTSARRQQSERDRRWVRANARRLDEDVQLLQFGGCDDGAVVAIVEFRAASARERNRQGRELVQAVSNIKRKFEMHVIETPLAGDCTCNHTGPID